MRKRRRIAWWLAPTRMERKVGGIRGSRGEILLHVFKVASCLIYLKTPSLTGLARNSTRPQAFWWLAIETGLFSKPAFVTEVPTCLSLTHTLPYLSHCCKVRFSFQRRRRHVPPIAISMPALNFPSDDREIHEELMVIWSGEAKRTPWYSP